MSHHPPIMAEYYENKKTGIYHMGHYELKASFAGTVVKARVVAVNTTTLVAHDEEYVCTYPTFVIRGFFVAAPFFDQVGQATITCAKTNLQAIIDYKDKVGVTAHVRRRACTALSRGALTDVPPPRCSTHASPPPRRPVAAVVPRRVPHAGG